MKWKKRMMILAAFLFFTMIVCVWYVNDYYHSDESVQKYLQETASASASVSITEIPDGLFLDGPGEDTAIIFYPGAKVEYTAYVPLFGQLSEQGIDCFLIKMPCNLAFLGKNKAEKIMDSYEYDNWYLSGHSLGGAMAASFASRHLESLSGMVFFASYPTESLKSDSFSVLSIYGSEDGVLNMDKITEGKKLMPDDYTEICIEGGNHAQFGNYGEQKGDHAAWISRKEQQEQTVDAVLQMTAAHKGQTQEDVKMSYKNALRQPVFKGFRDDVLTMEVRVR